jgi:hypothetical protein
VIAFYDKRDKRNLVLDASKYYFKMALGTGGSPALNAYVDLGIAEYQIIFMNNEDRDHMVEELDWFSKNGDPKYAAVMINYASDWWLES